MKTLDKNSIRYLTYSDIRRTKFKHYVQSLVDTFPNLDYRQLSIASGLSEYDIRRALGLIQ